MIRCSSIRSELIITNLKTFHIQKKFSNFARCFPTQTKLSRRNLSDFQTKRIPTFQLTTISTQNTAIMALPCDYSVMPLSAECFESEFHQIWTQFIIYLKIRWYCTLNMVKNQENICIDKILQIKRSGNQSGVRGLKVKTRITR